MEENLEMKSYLKFSEIISFIQKEFKNSEYPLNQLKTLNQNQERVFLGIIEIIDIEQEENVFLDDVSIHLSHIFTREKTKSLLEELNKIGVISMSSSLSYQIFPDWERTSWNDYLPSNLSLNLTSSEEILKQTISKNRFKNIYGYFKKDEKSFLKNITELIRKNYVENTNVVIVQNTDLTFNSDSSGKSIRVYKKDKSPFSGIVFSLDDNYSDTERNGSLSSLTTYKNGLQDGVNISFSFKLIIEKSLWENGVELSVEKFDDEGKSLKNNESVTYVERHHLDLGDLKLYANLDTRYLTWVVKDMSSNETVFTSDSSNECERWISGDETKSNKEIKNIISVLINELLNSDNFTLEKFKSSIPQILLNISSEEFIEILTKDNRDFVDNSNGEIVENKDLINLTREHFDKNEDLNSEEFIENMSKSFFENLKSENDSTNAHDGEFLSYYENGEIKEKGDYKNGKKNGESKKYYESGQLKEKISYENGNLESHRSYHENGNRKSLFVKLPSSKSKWVFQCYSENDKLIKSDIVKDIHELKEKKKYVDFLEKIASDSNLDEETRNFFRVFNELQKNPKMFDNEDIVNRALEKKEREIHPISNGGCLVVILFLLSLTLSLIIQKTIRNGNI